MITFSKFIEAVISSGKRTAKVNQFGVKTASIAAPFGDDSQPLKDTAAIFANTSNNAEPVVIGYINKNQLAGPGEKRIFSVDEHGAVISYIWCKSDGTIEFSGTADNLVRYSKLETAFNELKTDFNNLVTAYNAHVHISAAPGSPNAPTPSQATPSAADITPAKISEFKSI